MKSLQNKETLATAALLCAGILGGLAPIAAKILLRELPPFTLTFFRYSIALVVILPLFYRFARTIAIHWKQLILVSVCFSGNIFFFILGIGHTTSALSQLLYAGVPILMLFEQAVVTKIPIQTKHLLGVFLGVFGTIIIVFHQADGGVGLGTSYGNTLLLFATVCWSLYLLITKRVSQHVTPLAITTTASFLTWVLSIPAMFLFEGNQLSTIFSLSLLGWLTLLFIGLVLSIVMWYLYNFGIKHGSTLLTSSIVYVNTATAGIAGYVVFGEKITSSFFLGGAFLISGVYLISRKKSSTGKTAI
ncbi:DMT family transporter [Candidatus Gottesmanbacteria bacterium]|nr:DMT family transporter [Candidatus Gottesmanbacteria bacterium]